MLDFSAVLFLLYISSSFCRPYNNLWEDHKRQYSLNFSPEEEQLRYETFANNQNYILGFNAKNDNFKLKLNKFAHLKNEEVFAQAALTSRYDTAKLINSQSEDNYKIEKLPNHIDYSKHVPFVMRDDGYCNGGWFMSVITTLEYLLRLKKNINVSLSPQFILDCGYASHGCNGGFPEIALVFATHLGLIEENSYHPYKAMVNKCNLEANTNNNVYQIQGYNFMKMNITAIKHFLNKHGPLIVGTTATFRDFLYYKEGIYSDYMCQEDFASTSHYMTLVGYGRDTKTSEEYFILQNSWGSEWGENGFVRMSLQNNCGLTLSLIYPKV